MARINSRNKGAKNERLACIILQQWTKKTFARVPSSGGLGWHNNLSTGDVMCTKEGHYFPFSIEVKARESLNLDHLLYLKNAEILKFWEQSKRDAKRLSKCPVVMMRYNGLPKGFFFIILPRVIYHKFLKEHIGPEESVIVSPTFNFVILTTWALLRIPYKEIRKPIADYCKAYEIE